MAGEQDRKTEQVLLETFRVRRMLVWALTLACATLAGLLASRILHPLNNVLIGLWVVGGAAAAVLGTMIPGQAWRVLRRGWIYLGLARRRRLLRRLVRAERATLMQLPDEQLSYDRLCDLAAAEFLRGQHEVAEAYLAHALEVAPEQAELLNNLGVVQAAQGQHGRAAELFVRALTDGAEDLAAVNCALVAAQVQEAERLAQMIVETGRPLTPMALNNLGVAVAQRGQWEVAEQWFARAAHEAPELAAARANLGLVAYHQGRYPEAGKEILQASRQDPTEPAFASHLGVILAATGQLDQARGYLRQAHRMDPASMPIRMNLTALEGASGHWHLAHKGFTALVGQRERRADNYYNLAVCELAIQEPAAAADAAAAAIAGEDTSAEAYTVLAVALWEVGRKAEALSHFQTAMGAADAGPVAISNLGRALLLQGNIEAAGTALEAAVKRWPEDPHLVFDLATAHLAMAAAEYEPGAAVTDHQTMMSHLQRCHAGLQSGLEHTGLMVEAQVNLGLYHYLQEQYEAAAAQFEAAQRLWPRNRELSLLIGTALGQEGERQTHRTGDGDMAPTAAGRGYLRRAVPYLQAALETRDTLVPASHNLGRCQYVLKDYEQALAAFRRSIRIENSQEINSMAALAAARQAQRIQLLVKTQLLSDVKRDQLRARWIELLNVAVHYFRQALLRNEMDPTLHGNIGLAYMLRNHENDVEAALRHWERMRAIGGGAMENRYAELAQMENLADPTRVGFDDRNDTLRGLEPLRWVTVPALRATGLRYAIEPVAVQRPWRLSAAAPRLQRALQLRDAIAAAELRLARLRV
jgi:tetratricopeptide (TPR) repeat protein